MNEREYIKQLDKLYPQVLEVIKRELGTSSPQLIEDTLRNLADQFAAENGLDPYYQEFPGPVKSNLDDYDPNVER